MNMDCGRTKTSVACCGGGQLLGCGYVVSASAAAAAAAGFQFDDADEELDFDSLGYEVRKVTCYNVIQISNEADIFTKQLLHRHLCTVHAGILCCWSGSCTSACICALPTYFVCGLLPLLPAAGPECDR
jgi:hypothetical protein